jgi:hypothetical protein
MTESWARQRSSWVFPALMAGFVILSTGCAGESVAARYAGSSAGSKCYAKALPTAGEGGLAWGSTLSIARNKSMANCARYADRSGGTPTTCQVVLAECRK